MESQAAAQASNRNRNHRPLCVDLDGSLVKSDTLVDSLLVLARTRPLALGRLPGLLLQGKAAFKAYVTSLVRLDVVHLPYNFGLLEYLKAEYAGGRKIYLVTGADAKLARRVAAHLHLFEDVLASDGSTNLTGENKLAGVLARFEGGFDYVGNAMPDLPMLAQAQEPMVANPDARLSRVLKRRGIHVTRTFTDRQSLPTVLRKALRLHQWAKNVLMFLPLMLAHTLTAEHLARTGMAFFYFGLCASGTYILNDLLDIEADRRHPKKRLRPFAAADLSPITGVAISSVFLLVALVGAFRLSPEFLHWLLLYLVLTASYSLYIKRVASLDVILLAGLYTLRILAGGAATQTPISPWMAAFSIFFFLSLAMVKRFSELHNTRERGQVPASGRGYRIGDLEQLRSAGTASAYASIVVFSLYINGSAVSALYRHPARMWAITPLMILWISQVLLLAGRGELDEDPVLFALTNRMSLLIGFAALLVVLSAI